MRYSKKINLLRIFWAFLMLLKCLNSVQLYGVILLFFCYFLLLVWFCLFLCVEEKMKNGVQGRGCVGKRGKNRESSGASKREVRRSTVGCC